MADRVTLAQVADEVGVSVMTVSNVLNGRPGASEATRKRIKKVADRLGYTPNSAARNLKGGHTGLIGVVTLDLTTQYALEIVRGIADELADAELEVLISASYQDAIREYDRVDFLSRGVVDGIVLVAPVLADRTIQLLKERGRPFIVVDPRQLDVKVPRVVVDNYGGMREAAQHLIDLGHKKIAFLRGAPDFESSATRYSGFVDAMKLAGLDTSAKLVAECDFTYAFGFKAATQIIKKEHPTAIVCGADVLALGAVDAARALGLSIPDDMSVIGFDDLPQATHSFPGLTTVRQPLHDMGQVAARALLGQIDGTAPLMERMQMPTSLVVRGTTARPH